HRIVLRLERSLQHDRGELEDRAPDGVAAFHPEAEAGAAAAVLPLARAERVDAGRRADAHDEDGLLALLRDELDGELVPGASGERAGLDPEPVGRLLGAPEPAGVERVADGADLDLPALGRRGDDKGLAGGDVG